MLPFVRIKVFFLFRIIDKTGFYQHGRHSAVGQHQYALLFNAVTLAAIYPGELIIEQIAETDTLLAIFLDLSIQYDQV